MTSFVGAVQVVTSQALWSRLLYCSHHSVMEGHPRHRRLYDAPRIKFYWLRIANDVYRTVGSYSECTRNRVEHKLKRQLQLYFESGPVESFALKILGLLRRTAEGNRYVTTMTDRYSELTRALPTGRTSSVHVTNVFFDSWIDPCGIPAYFLADNHVHFTSNLFATLCAMIGLKYLTTTAYHSETNGQTKR